MTPKKKITEYIHHHFGKDIKVKFQKRIKGGYAAEVLSDNTIVITDEIRNHFYYCYRDVIWHEVGHIKTSGKTDIERETNAQLWAIRELEKRGYNKMRDTTLVTTVGWIYKFRKKKGHTKYAKAGNKILEKLGI